MIVLELSTAEAEVLMATLEHTISDLRMEIANTDQMDFREGLKRRKELLISIHDRLGPPQARQPQERLAAHDF